MGLHAQDDAELSQGLDFRHWLGMRNAPTRSGESVVWAPPCVFLQDACLPCFSILPMKGNLTGRKELTIWRKHMNQRLLEVHSSLYPVKE